MQTAYDKDDYDKIDGDFNNIITHIKSIVKARNKVAPIAKVKSSSRDKRKSIAGVLKVLFSQNC